MSKDFLVRKDPNTIATDSAHLTTEPKSAEEYAAEKYYFNDVTEDLNELDSERDKRYFLAGTSWQREREADLEIQISCLEKALMIRDEREAKLVEALEFYAREHEHWKESPFEENKARAALLKYRGGEQIKKETCKHEPVQIWTGAYEDDLNPKIKFRCLHCGVELQATWGEL
jgi:hypothetical protein